MNCGKFNLLLPFALCALLFAAGCPPAPVVEVEEGKFLSSRNTLFDADREFDIRDTVIYPEGVKGGSMPDPSLNVSNRQLFINRCLWCHECGAPRAIDWVNYGTPQWNPRYIGGQWAVPVQRMRDKPNSFLNEQIAERIFTYLRDDTLGIYEEEEDESGKIIREVDEETYKKLQEQATERQKQLDQATKEKGAGGVDNA